MSTRRVRSLVIVIVLACIAGPVARVPAMDLDASHEVGGQRRVALRLAGEPAPIIAEILSWTHRSLTIEPRAGDDDKGPEAQEIQWTDLEPAQAFDLRRSLMDAKDADQWIMLGVLMLDMNDADRADRAFTLAKKLSPETQRVADEARRLHGAGERAEAALADHASGEGAPGTPSTPKPAPKPESTSAPSTRTAPRSPGSEHAPTGGDPDATAWPPSTDGERMQETLRVRDSVSAYFKRAGFSLFAPLQTDHFLLYSELPRAETKRWANALDGMYDTLLGVLEMTRGAELFKGRCAIIIFSDRERFIAFEQNAMGSDAVQYAGVTHMGDGYTFVCFFRDPDSARFQSVLLHETTHAFMYRYRSPAELPTWANEGLADYVAGWLTPAAKDSEISWSIARHYVLSGQRVLDIMAQSYDDGSWPSDDSYPVSEMIVRFMLKKQPSAFKLWIDDIKGGMDWRDSLSERYGLTPEALADAFAKDITGEKSYTGLR